MDIQQLKKQIAPMVNEAKHSDGCSVNWLYTTEYEKSLAYDKVDSMLSLLDSPDSPYILKSEVVKRIREIENPYKDDDVRFYAPFELAFVAALQKAVELFEEVRK
jgi:hypothetical protein